MFLDKKHMFSDKKDKKHMFSDKKSAISGAVGFVYISSE